MNLVANVVSGCLRRGRRGGVDRWYLLRRSKSSSAANVAQQQSSAAVEHPPLKTIPSLPVFGSTISAYSGTPPMDQNARENFVNYQRTLHGTYGPFYRMGIPAIGTGLFAEVHIIRDPQEMLKVIKKEGVYPSGFIENEWPMIHWMKKSNNEAMLAFHGRGEGWKRIRSELQKDLLAPASARGYLPGMIRGAEKASPGASKFAEEKNLNRYLNFCAMDMFTGVLFGSDKGMSDEDYREFCRSAVEGLGGLFKILRDPYEFVCHKVFYETPAMKRCFEDMNIMHEIADRRLRAFLERIRADEVNEDERNSYFYKFVQRQPETDLSIDEVIEICSMLMLAAVDTTAGKTGWNIVQMALNPSAQDRVYEQLDRAVQKEGSLTASIIEQSMVPLLPAFVRETHRCTPAAAADIMKKVSDPIEIHGVNLPAGSTVMFDPLTTQMDPSLVEDPMVFKPERWLKESVEDRKNTPSQVIDHVFFSGPFSQGARRCPGSRVANLEVQVMLAQLLLDWRIEGPSSDDVHWKDVRGNLETVFVPQFPEGTRFVPRS